jgi:hypothetical protein
MPGSNGMARLERDFAAEGELTRMECERLTRLISGDTLPTRSELVQFLRREAERIHRERLADDEIYRVRGLSKVELDAERERQADKLLATSRRAAGQ